MNLDSRTLDRPCVTNFFPTKHMVEEIQLTDPLHNGHLRDRRKWPLWSDCYADTTFFREVPDMFIVPSPCLL